MEDFMARVAWPGVQPSPLGVGEASAGHEPLSKVTPEVTLEATPWTSPVTISVVEVSEEEDGAADIDYAANMTTTQSTWDPWPTATQETPQPAQDTSFSPQDEPTAPQEEL